VSAYVLSWELTCSFRGLLFSRRGFFSGQSGVHRGICADFVIATVGPSHDGKIADIDLRDAVLPNGNPAEDAISDGNGAEEKLALLVYPWPCLLYTSKLPIA